MAIDYRYYERPLWWKARLLKFTLQQIQVGDNDILIV